MPLSCWIQHASGTHVGQAQHDVQLCMYMSLCCSCAVLLGRMPASPVRFFKTSRWFCPARRSLITLGKLSGAAQMSSAHSLLCGLSPGAQMQPLHQQATSVTGKPANTCALMGRQARRSEPHSGPARAQLTCLFCWCAGICTPCSTAKPQERGSSLCSTLRTCSSRHSM